MNKKTIIIISCIAVVVIALIVILILIKTKTKTILLIKYNDDFQVTKTLEIKNKKLYKACAESALIKDGVSQYLALEIDYKLDMQDGRYFSIQEDLNEYCYYENTKTGNKMNVKMPEGLLDYIKELSY